MLLFIAVVHIQVKTLSAHASAASLGLQQKAVTITMETSTHMDTTTLIMIFMTVKPANSFRRQDKADEWFVVGDEEGDEDVRYAWKRPCIFEDDPMQGHTSSYNLSST